MSVNLLLGSWKDFLLILNPFSAPPPVRVKEQIQFVMDFLVFVSLFPPEFSGSLQGALRGVSSVQPHAVRPCSELQGVGT